MTGCAKASNPFAAGRHRNGELGLRPRWTLALQEEFIKHQGPYSEPLNTYLETHCANTDRSFFVTYLYPTTYFGLYRLAATASRLFAPTLHDEQPAYLPAFKHAAHRAREMVWLTGSRVTRRPESYGEICPVASSA
jgi:hypothetical protein